MEPLEERLRALMLEALAGDAGSYRTLLHDVSAHLHRYYLRRLGRSAMGDCEDLVQETLMAVHAHRATYDTDRPFTAWLHAIARYKLVDHFRRSGGRRTVPLDETSDLFSLESEQDPAATHDMERVLSTIPAQQSGLIRRVKLEGRSIAEAAAWSGLSESAVKVSIHRGLKALAARFRRSTPR